MKKSYNNKWVILILILVIIVLLFYIAWGNKNNPSNVKDKNQSPVVSNLKFDPLNFSYDIEGEKIVLKDGSSSMDIVPGSAEKLDTVVFDKPAIGDLNNDNIQDSALVLVQDSGGTGLFYYLVAVVYDAGITKNTNSVFIGDRIDPKNISINNGVITFNYLDRKQDDPMSADPTIFKSRNFVVKGGELIEKK